MGISFPFLQFFHVLSPPPKFHILHSQLYSWWLLYVLPSDPAPLIFQFSLYFQGHTAFLVSSHKLWLSTWTEHMDRDIVSQKIYTQRSVPCPQYNTSVWEVVTSFGSNGYFENFWVFIHLKIPSLQLSTSGLLSFLWELQGFFSCFIYSLQTLICCTSFNCLLHQLPVFLHTHGRGISNANKRVGA